MTEHLDKSRGETERIAAEIRRIDAETAKLAAEKTEIEKRTKEPLYLRYIVQAVITGITLAGLLGVLIKVQLEPMLTVGIEVAKKQNELESLRNEIAQEKYNRDVVTLREKNQQLHLEQGRLQSIAEARIREIRRKGTETVEMQKELTALQKQVKDLSEAKAKTELRSKELATAFSSTNLPTTVPILLGSSALPSTTSSLSLKDFSETRAKMELRSKELAPYSTAFSPTAFSTTIPVLSGSAVGSLPTSSFPRICRISSGKTCELLGLSTGLSTPCFCGTELGIIDLDFRLH
jgi:hypothetical protein